MAHREPIQASIVRTEARLLPIPLDGMLVIFARNPQQFCIHLHSLKVIDSSVLSSNCLVWKCSLGIQTMGKFAVSIG